MPIASGILKVTSWKKQSGLGVPSAGASGKTARRTSSMFKADRDTFESNEIATHHQSTGVAYGMQKADGKIDGLLSAGTFADLFASILEKDFATGIVIGTQTITYAGSTPNWTLTGTGLMAGTGLKVGDIIRASGGSVTANNARNLLITALTNTVATVYALDEVAVSPGASVTTILTVVGKKTNAPITGHTKDYYSIEEWYSDLSKSELFTDMRVGSVAVSLPATGNGTVSIDFVGLGRTVGVAQVLTSPVTTSTAIMTAVNGTIYINGANQVGVTGINFTVSNEAANAGARIGFNTGAEVTTGRIKVSGSLTAQFDSTTLQTLLTGETNTSIVVALTGDTTGTADCMSFAMSRVKLTSDTADDGEKAIVRTYSFVAEYNPSGGSGTANDQSILSIVDSAA